MPLTSSQILSISNFTTSRHSWVFSSRIIYATTSSACSNNVILPPVSLNPRRTSRFYSNLPRPPRLRLSLSLVTRPGVHSATAEPSHSVRHTSLQAITGDGASMDAYHFPDGRLQKKMEDPSKTPLLLVACGSFSPITFLHLRMFMMARDYVRFSTEFEIIGGYLSPVSDAYKKQGLSPAEHR